MTIVTYDMSEDTKIREAARMREKALHDEASALGAARREGRAEGEAEGLAEAEARMRAAGLSEEFIKSIVSGAGQEGKNTLAFSGNICYNRGRSF